jgi:tRNA threonylcarbamoyladenosine biosynthesis protein TsaE
MKVDFLSSGEEDTFSIARALGGILKPGDVIALTGDLGAGKTLFCKGVGAALGISPGRIVSPSFTMVTEYRGVLPLCHVDAYRLSSEEEARDIGLDEILAEERVFLVEWAEKIRSLLPNNCIRVTFSISGEDRRRISFEAEDDPRFAEFVSCVRPLIPGG